MKKIIVLSLVAILIAAGAGWVLTPGYVSIETAFSNTGQGESGVHSYTTVNGFGTVDLAAVGTGYYSSSNINVYEKVELGDPGCWQCGCTELDKVVSSSWTNADILGMEQTVINGWIDDYSDWLGTGTGSFYKKVDVDKFTFPCFGCGCK